MGPTVTPSTPAVISLPMATHASPEDSTLLRMVMLRLGGHAPVGGAVPGDRIVGILTPGEGITIYPIQSPALTHFDDQPERWLDVRWDIEDSVPQRFPAQLAVTAINEPGSLATVAAIIGESDGNIDSISMTGKTADFREMLISVEVWDLKHLSAIIAQLRTKPVISAVSRVNG